MATGFSDIYEYSSGGLIVPKTDKIRENIVNYMYQIFGENLSLEDGTNTRKFVDNLTNLFADLLKFSVNNSNMMNFAYAGGKNLDYLAEFFGIYRLKANRSQCSGTIYIDSSKIDQTKTYIIPAYSQFLTVNNVIIQTKRDIIINGSAYINMIPVSFEAVDDGPIYIEVGNIIPISSGLDFILVNSTFQNQYTAVLSNGCFGRSSESDIEMKNRISYSRGYGSSTTNTIVNAIYKADPTISCVQCIENKTSSQKTIDGAIVSPNSILIVIDNLEFGNIYKINSIAKAIYNTVPAGCNITDISESTDINLQSLLDDGFTQIQIIEDGEAIRFLNMAIQHPYKCIVNIKDDYGVSHKIAFYVAGIGNQIHIEVSVRLNGYKGDDIQNDIQNIIMSYISSKIGTISKDEITSLISTSISGVFVTDVKFYNFDSSSYVNSISSTALYHLTLAKAFNSPYGVEVTVE